MIFIWVCLSVFGFTGCFDCLSNIFTRALGAIKLPSVSEICTQHSGGGGVSSLENSALYKTLNKIQTGVSKENEKRQIGLAGLRASDLTILTCIMSSAQSSCYNNNNNILHLYCIFHPNILLQVLMKRHNALVA